MGIPLTIAFQLLVRRRPVRELLVRGEVGARLTVRDQPPRRRGDRPACTRPALLGLEAASGGNPWTIGWYAAAVVGAGAAAYALRSTSVPAMLRSAALPTAVGVVANVLVVGGVQLRPAPPSTRWPCS